MKERRQRLKQKVFQLKESFHFSLENGLKVHKLKGEDSSLVLMTSVKGLNLTSTVHRENRTDLFDL